MRRAFGGLVGLERRGEGELFGLTAPERAGEPSRTHLGERVVES